MKRFTTLFLVLIMSTAAMTADEGMYPLSELQKLKLKSKGIKLEAKDLYNPNGISLVDAIVQLGGCTGSFVSNDGLVITNHHCAFGAVQAASTPEHDYITTGFIAGTREGEIPARGLTVRITESYRDVSREVLSAVNDTMDFAVRARQINDRRSAITAEAEKANPGKRAEVAEMFAGRTYVLFLYATFRDVRLVYVPPRSIGEFGGEDDNWVWPRHTGDFSFVRVYVGPDGKAADFAKENLPYHPKKFLRINPKGVDENDAVFILGYPGRTFRHRTSHYLDYEQRVRMPFIADWYEWQIATMEELGARDRAIAMKFDSRIKGLANTSKNYRGKLQGLARLDLVGKKAEEEALLQAFIDAEPKRKQIYGTVLSELGKVYADMNSAGVAELLLDQLRSAVAPLTVANTLQSIAREMEKADSVRPAPYQDKARLQTYRNFRSSSGNYYEPAEKLFLGRLLTMASGLGIAPLDSFVRGDYGVESIRRAVDAAFAGSMLAQPGTMALNDSVVSVMVAANSDPFVRLAKDLRPLFSASAETRQRREGALSKYSALYVDVKEQFQKKDFIPDANSTLRFTYGAIRGYSPKDATSFTPITTVAGVLQKTTGVPPYYDTPKTIVDAAKRKAFGKFKHPRLNDVPVAILYDTDTTGGNSGSPVMNGNGELIGVNFDRAWEATINDYAWSASYSRSIAVDIRYVLWVVSTLGGGDPLLAELGTR